MGKPADISAPRASYPLKQGVVVLLIRGKKRWLLFGGLGVVMLAAGLFVWMGLTQGETVSVFSPSRLRETTIVIDPGHGGEDGGAVSEAGVSESAINLAVGEKLDALLRFYGVQTAMTRESELSIHDPGAKTLRERKRSDLHNRVDMIEAIPGALLISIHQNAYPNPKYHGMQVFYRDEDSRALAQQMQGNVSAFLDAENKRQALKIPNAVYLMKNVTCRAVLAECGFVSNPEEAARLQEEGYQKKIALSIAAACLNEQTIQGVFTS